MKTKGSGLVSLGFRRKARIWNSNGLPCGKTVVSEFLKKRLVGLSKTVLN